MTTRTTFDFGGSVGIELRTDGLYGLSLTTETSSAYTLATADELTKLADAIDGAIRSATITGPAELGEVRLGGRNFLRVGDPVKVKPSQPGKRDGYIGTARRIVSTGAGVEVEVAGGPQRNLRTFRLDRLARTTKAAR